MIHPEDQQSSIAKIAVSAAAYQIDKPYDYNIPERFLARAAPGVRVVVPFGRGNKKCEGIILSLTHESVYTGENSKKALKDIEQLLDEGPVLGEDHIKLALWMSDRFFCTVYEAVRAMLPAGMWFREGVRPLGDKTVSVAVLRVPGEEAAALTKQKLANAPRQAAVLQMLSAAGSMQVKEICHFTGAASATLRALEKQGVLSVEELKVFRRPDTGTRAVPAPVFLNGEQNAVFEIAVPLLRSARPEAALLYGVTGSGKTLIYIKLIEEAITLGKTAIVLVPEIALTPQMVSIFASHFGNSVAVLHSALVPGERYDEWKRIRSGDVRVVVGTRSAVFAPLPDLGLIVVDEEQEQTYKSENSPRYHARDIAKYLVARANAFLLLSSATPSVASMYSAKTGKYNLFRIGKRYNERALPAVITVDMRKELRNGNAGSISSVLRSELEKNISAGEQSILFINRRGANPLVTCGECGFVFRCGNCSVSMTYHSANKRLICHYCGFSLPIPVLCPECGGKLKFIGAGTQKAEEELLELFPGVKIIRMDADTVTRSNSHAGLLAKFRDGEAQILLGTQMVAKGLDFENVTLVGVLSADLTLYMSDYRAHERTFSLITQVVGRAGRGGKQGRAVIQTFTPEHEVIKLASRQDYDSFYEREMILRQALSSPPARDLLAVTASGVDEAAVLDACGKLRGALEHYFGKSGGVRILGPAPMSVTKVKNRYRYRLLVNCENTKRVRDIVAHSIKEFARDNSNRGISVFADPEIYD